MAGKPRLQHDDEIRAWLTQHGVRVTEQRVTLLRELGRARSPVSHSELTERLAHSSLDRVTIYRNLVSLAEAGLLVRSQLGDHVWRYELPQSAAREHGKHPHFVCVDCGDVTCLPEGDVLLHGTVARNEVSDVQLRGRCVVCVRG
jgi:Fur family ferric uptake transcriptional regulator